MNGHCKIHVLKIHTWDHLTWSSIKARIGYITTAMWGMSIIVCAITEASIRIVFPLPVEEVRKTSIPWYKWSAFCTWSWQRKSKPASDDFLHPKFTSHSETCYALLEKQNSLCIWSPHLPNCCHFASTQYSAITQQTVSKSRKPGIESVTSVLPFLNF